MNDKFIKIMTREEMLKFCSICKNRKMDLNRGLVCTLTDNYADFDPVCENYSQDIVEKQSRSTESETNKKPGLMGYLHFLYLLIIVAVFFVIVSGLLINTSPTLIIIVSGLNVLAIAAIAIFNIRYFKQLKKLKSEGGEITLEKIMDCIRKEGYYPQKQDDEHIVFKIQGLSINVYYYADTQYFQLQIKYLINNEQQMPAVEKAALYTMSRIWLIKIVTRQVEENNGLIFSVEGFTSSFSEFEKKFFQTYMSILFDALGLYREYFNKISEEQHEDEAPRPKIGFPTSSSNIKS